MRMLRVTLVLVRPAVVALLGMFTAVGMAAAGEPDDPWLLTRALVVVVAFLLFAVSVNDLADEAIDRVNLARDPRRPLVVGTATHRQMRIVASVAAVVALGGGFALGGPTVLVVVGGLAFATAYSIPPWRLASRGIVAPLLLPFGYVAVPYLTGAFAVRTSLTGRDLALAAGLYVGFIGRIVLKDFRDVAGDRLFGKRTWLVRHGRTATCRLSAVCSIAGTTIVVATADRSLTFAISELALLVTTLLLLRALADDRGHRRDERLISTVAICGRGIILILLAQLTLANTDLSNPYRVAVLAGLTIVLLGQAGSMARHGPALKPAPDWAYASTAA
jgi:4-hydroxybenzoate polyprenyltransferase